MFRPRKVLLGKLLVDAGAVTQDELDQALFVQRKKGGLLGDILVQQGAATDVVVATAVANQTGIPLLVPEPSSVPSAVRPLVSEADCRRFRLVPLRRNGTFLELAMANPFDVAALAHIGKSTGLTPFPSIAPSGAIQRVIARTFSAR